MATNEPREHFKIDRVRTARSKKSGSPPDYLSKHPRQGARVWSEFQALPKEPRPEQIVAKDRIFFEIEALNELPSLALEERFRIQVHAAKQAKLDVGEYRDPNEPELPVEATEPWHVTAFASIPAAEVPYLGEQLLANRQPADGLEQILHLRENRPEARIDKQIQDQGQLQHAILSFAPQITNNEYNQARDYIHKILGERPFKEIKPSGRPPRIATALTGQDAQRIAYAIPLLASVTRDGQAGFPDDEPLEATRRVSFSPEQLPEPVGSIAILDSGIDAENPWVKPVLGFSRDYTNTGLADTSDHGTGVATTAAYGMAFTEDEPPETIHRVHVAKVIVGDRTDLVSDVMENIQQAVNDILEHDPTCRVFNLSLTDKTPGARRTAFTERLDELARQHHILFTCALGNTDVDKLLPQWDYPDYFRDQEHEGTFLLAPSDASSVISVGSTTKFHPETEATPWNLAPYHGPAPHTRRGWSFEDNIFKPDLVHEGGSIRTHDEEGPVEVDPHRSIIAASSKYELGWFVGTSFSAPLVANCAATLFARLGIQTANAVKALLLNTAHLPEATLDYKRLDGGIRTLMGHGIPDVNRAMHSAANRVTFYFEGSARLDQSTFVPVHIPQDFLETRCARRISMTICYNPPGDIDGRERRYQVVDLKGHLHIPGFDPKKLGGDKEGRSTFGDSRYFPVRHSSIVIPSGARNIRRAPEGTWELEIEPTVSKHHDIDKATTGQPFAVAFTIECINHSIDIHRAVAKALNRAQAASSTQ